MPEPKTGKDLNTCSPCIFIAAHNHFVRGLLQSIPTAPCGWLVHGSSMGRMNAIDQVGPMVNGVIFTVVAVLV